MPRAGYVPGLDGLRALAVLAVLLFHLHVPWFALGWSGVTLFFAISGFLITRILLESRESPNYYSSFYGRRALRIFPIYYLYLASRIAFDLHTGFLDPVWPWFLVYLQTVPQLRAGFKNGPTETQHTWSLAVEEQFYALWPLAVRALSPRGLGVLVAALVLAAPVCRALRPDLAATSLPGQLDALGLGAGLALWVRAGARPARVEAAGWLAAFLGTAAVVGAVVATGSREPGAVLSSGLALLSVGLVALALGGWPKLVRALEARPLAAVGRVSYGVYLYHQCVFREFDDQLVAAERRWPGTLRLAASPLAHTALVLLAVGLTLGLAALSWRLVEQPILRLKSRLAARPPEPAPPPAPAPAPEGPA